MMIGAEIYPNQKFDFLGYTFRPRLSRTDGAERSAPRSAPRPATKRSRRSGRRSEAGPFTIRSDKTLDDLARMVNAHIRGWINYYGRFYPSALYPTLRPIDVFLARWADRKFKSLRRHKTRAVSTGCNASRAARPACSLIGPCSLDAAEQWEPMTRECPVRLCESAGAKLPRATRLSSQDLRPHGLSLARRRRRGRGPRRAGPVQAQQACRAETDAQAPEEIWLRPRSIDHGRFALVWRRRPGSWD